MSSATASTQSIPGMESFEALFAESLLRQEMRAGEVITAEVVRVDHNHVVVNAGLKSESFIPIEEFKNDQGEIEAKPGDYVSVAIEMLEDGYGETRLSRDKAKRIAAWNDLDKAMNESTLVKGMITGKVKGGLTGWSMASVHSCRVRWSIFVRSRTLRRLKARNSISRSSNLIASAITSLCRAAP